MAWLIKHGILAGLEEVGYSPWFLGIATGFWQGNPGGADILRLDDRVAISAC
jgi:hypothetical protein